MSDSQGPKFKGIPSWQRQESSSPSNQPDGIPPQEQAEQEQTPEPRASLIQTASEFLNDESIRNAPTERKKVFLESKGLSGAETDNLLGIQHAPEEEEEAAVTEDYEPEQQQNEASQSTPSQTPNQDQQPQATPSPPQSNNNENPPIITYPEFLLHAQTPAPLITASRLLTSLSVVAGTMATIYGTSTYLIEPMFSTLTSARHSLFSAAGTNLDTLNKKLEGAAPKVPPLSSKEEMKEEEEEEAEDSDAESTVSTNGARFFRRSAGTQTSPRRLSRSDPTPIAAEADERGGGGGAGGGGGGSPAQEHTSALLSIHSRLSDLLPPTGPNGEPTNPLGDSISELRAYLEKLPHENFTARSVRKVWRRGQMVDAVADLKAEIRGVKGVLLSARNFPSAVAAR